jgi:hypothetical protein
VIHSVGQVRRGGDGLDGRCGRRGREGTMGGGAMVEAVRALWGVREDAR